MKKRELLQILLAEGELDDEVLVQTGNITYADFKIGKMPVLPMGQESYVEAPGSIEIVIAICPYELPETAKSLALEILGVERSQE